MTEFVKKHPYSVLLFDECEKGFPGIWDTLLSVLDEGEVADARGEVVNFRKYNYHPNLKYCFANDFA